MSRGLTRRRGAATGGNGALGALASVVVGGSASAPPRHPARAPQAAEVAAAEVTRVPGTASAV
ncbi:hypothetical protein GCM10023086_01960 [Streptomyces venetus]|uniref:Uncharacterized protein n=1 Tax=Streptomyces venetus TaxID=1701086 RepID=A0ABP8F1C3_9ACTN